MSERFTPEELEALMAAAEWLMPDEGRLPSVRAAGLAATHLEEALAARPEAEPLIAAFARLAVEHGVDAALRQVRDERPDLWEAVTSILPGGYLLSPAVREALGYRGQTPQAIPIGGEPDYADLISVVTDRGPVYRPTPDPSAST